MRSAGPVLGVCVWYSELLSDFIPRKFQILVEVRGHSSSSRNFLSSTKSTAPPSSQTHVSAQVECPLSVPIALMRQTRAGAQASTCLERARCAEQRDYQFELRSIEGQVAGHFLLSFGVDLCVPHRFMPSRIAVVLFVCLTGLCPLAFPLYPRMPLTLLRAINFSAIFSFSMWQMVCTRFIVFSLPLFTARAHTHLHTRASARVCMYTQARAATRTIS